MKEQIIRVVDKVFSTDITCSLGDILLQGDTLENGQLTVLSRFYDVTHFKNGVDKSFPFQNALSYITWGDRHDRETGNRNFETLIASYEKSGYKKGSRIILYKGAMIANGTHRLALNLYHRIWDVDANLMWRKMRKHRTIEWYNEKGLDPKWNKTLEDTKNEVDTILFNEGVTFVVIASVNSSNQIELLEALFRKKCKCFKMELCDKTIITRFSLSSPDYITKRGGLYSRTASRLYKEISKLGIKVLGCSFNCSCGRNLYRQYRMQGNIE